MLQTQKSQVTVRLPVQQYDLLIVAAHSQPPELPYQPKALVRPAAILLHYFFLPPSSTYGLALMLPFIICNAGLYFTVRVCHSRLVSTLFL